MDLYSEICEDGWVKLIVQPFRQEDMDVGSKLLRTKCPDVCSVCDYGDALPPKRIKGAVYGAAMHLSGNPATVLREYSERVMAWREAGGCARFVTLTPAAAAAIPSAIDIVLAVQEAEMVYVDMTVEDANVQQISSRGDEALHRLLFPDDD